MYRFFFADMNGLKPVVRCGVVIFGFAFLGGCRESSESKISELRGMARRPGPAQIRGIEGAFSDPNRDVRATALTLTAAIDPARGRDMALRALDDPDGVVRATGVRVLTSQPDTAPIERFTSMASLDSSWQVRTAALEGIATAEIDRIRTVFEQAMADARREVRHAALTAGVARPGLLPRRRPRRSWRRTRTGRTGSSPSRSWGRPRTPRHMRPWTRRSSILTSSSGPPRRGPPRRSLDRGRRGRRHPRPPRRRRRRLRQNARPVYSASSKPFASGRRDPI